MVENQTFVWLLMLVQLLQKADSACLGHALRSMTWLKSVCGNDKQTVQVSVCLCECVCFCEGGKAHVFHKTKSHYKLYFSEVFAITVCMQC